MRPLTRAPSPISGRSATMAISARAAGRESGGELRIVRARASVSSRKRFRVLVVDVARVRNVSAMSRRVRRRDFRQSRQQRVNEKPAAETRALRAGRREHARFLRSRRIGRTDQARPLMFRRRGFASPIHGVRLTALAALAARRVLSTSASPIHANACRRRAAISTPSCLRRALGQRVPGVRLDAVLVLEAADIEPVARAGERDIEKPAMLAQRLVCRPRFGRAARLRAPRVGTGNSTPSSV